MSVKMIDGPCATILAGAAIGLYLRVVHDGTDLALAGVNDAELGTIEEPSTAASTYATVRLRTAAGTQIFIAAGAISLGAKVFAAASGKVNDVFGAVYIGTALNATTADGDWVEVLRDADGYAGEGSVLEAKTADFDIEIGDSGKTYSSKGAAGAITGTLPAAVVGLKYRFYVGAAQEFRIDPDGTETISLPSTGVAGAAGKYLTANAIGETVELECCEAGTWAVFGFTGTWTAEA